jgi:UDP-N-acetylmuramoyl-tripeptide--D-alanyl-D-alanine ligase
MKMERSCGWITSKIGGRLVGNPTDRYLLVQGVSNNSRQIKTNQLFVPIVGEHFDGHQFIEEVCARGAAASLWQKDRPLPVNREIPFILVDDTLKALQRLASAYRNELAIPVVAITGSNGKTTTKDLVSAVLATKYCVHKTQGNFNNHIGVPLTLLSMSEQAEIAVVEMGMNHAGEIALLSQLAQPDVAVITNVGESHIEFLGSREGIANAKLEVREGLKANGSIIYDGDENLLVQALTGDLHPQIRVGWKSDNDEFPVDIVMNGFSGFSFRSNKRKTQFHLPLLGRHNIKNALLAVEVGRYFGLSEADIAKGLNQVQLTGMRLELETADNGMQIINDAYNASPTSMRAALNLLAELEPHLHKWALLGDIREIGSEEEKYHKELGRYAVEMKINRIYTTGEKGRWIAEGAKEANQDPRTEIRHFSSLDEASRVLLDEGNNQVLLLVKASRAAQLDQVVKNLIRGG